MIDVNGTRFHLAVGERDWLAQVSGASTPPQRGVEWVDGTIRLRKLVPVFPPRRGELPPDLSARRGAARDRYGNWYWIGDDGHDVRVARSGRRSSSRFWSAEEASRLCDSADTGAFQTCPPAVSIEPLQLAGLAVTADHYLVVGQTTPSAQGGLLIFDLRGGGAPLALTWPVAVPFTPFDISAASDGGVWILDRLARALWRLDRYFRIVLARANTGTRAAVFTPVAGQVDEDATVCPPTSDISPGAALRLEGVQAPVAVEALPDGSVLVLDNPAGSQSSFVHRWRLDGSRYRVALDTTLNPDNVLETGDDAGHPLPLVGYDFAFVRAAGEPSRPLAGSLFVVAREGNQTFAFDFRSLEDAFTLKLRREYLPMNRFTGKALVASEGQAFFDFGERYLTLVEHPATRFVREATVRLPAASDPDQGAYDGKEPQCVWHRLLVDGCVPQETEVVVQARSADDPQLLPFLPWQPQPLLYRRGNGAELPYYVASVDQRSDRAGTWELLFQNVVGRYLQLSITLKGTGRTAPKLHALRAYYPRFSYLREYLPAVYREDPESASFLDRYFANIEGTYTALEGRIEHVEALFDTRTVPAEFLDWLGGWLGASIDFSWSEQTKRLFLSHAPQMFRERGTCAGLVRAIRLALNSCPDESTFEDTPCGSGTATGFGVRVVERFRTRRAPGIVFGDPSNLLGPGSTTNLSDWTPARGAAPLHERSRSFLAARYGDDVGALNSAWGTSFASYDDPALRLAAVRPAGSAPAADWERFVRSEIGFTYAVVRDEDEPLYRDFLARRYRQPSDVNQAYGLDDSTRLTTFDDVRATLWNGQLRKALPESGVWLRDWILFVSTVLPVKRSAFQFTVLVPVSLNDVPETQLARRQLAERITEIEKPAHTVFDVKLYWGLFRVGEARTGLDTVLGPGSRSAALVLDRGLVSGSHLGFVEPWNVADRFVMGRPAEAKGGGSRAGVSGCGCQPHPAGGGCDCKRG